MKKILITLSLFGNIAFSSNQETSIDLSKLNNKAIFEICSNKAFYSDEAYAAAFREIEKRESEGRIRYEIVLSTCHNETSLSIEVSHAFNREIENSKGSITTDLINEEYAKLFYLAKEKAQENDYDVPESLPKAYKNVYQILFNYWIKDPQRKDYVKGHAPAFAHRGCLWSTYRSLKRTCGSSSSYVG